MKMYSQIKNTGWPKKLSKYLLDYLFGQTNSMDENNVIGWEFLEVMINTQIQVNFCFVLSKLSQLLKSAENKPSAGISTDKWYHKIILDNNKKNKHAIIWKNIKNKIKFHPTTRWKISYVIQNSYWKSFQKNLIFIKSLKIGNLKRK